MKVFVATIPTRYETMAVALTEVEARRIAAEYAHKFLSDVDALMDETETPEKVLDYFGCCVTEVEIGSANFVGV